MLLRIWYEVIAKKFLYERMYKIYKVLVFLRVTFLLIPIPFCLQIPHMNMRVDYALSLECF